MMVIRYCHSCLIPSTRPGTSMNAHGICQPCEFARSREARTSRFDWNESHLTDLLLWARSQGHSCGSPYDCLVPVSGGKDSVFQVEVAIRHGLRVAAVNAVPLARSGLRAANMETIRALGADVFEVDIRRPERTILSKMGLISVGIPNWPQHILSVTVPFRLAIDLGIKLVLWGENPEVEYGGPQDLATQTEMTAEWFARRGGAEAASLVEMERLSGVSLTGDRWYTMPSDSEIKAHGIRAAFLGQYTKWSSLRSYFVALSVGFETAQKVPQGALWPFENLDDPLYLIHDWLKFLKYGFGRCSDHVSISIREGLISREDGGRIVERLEGRYPDQYLDWILDELLRLLDSDETAFKQTCGFFANRALFEVDNEGFLILDKDRPRMTAAFTKAREDAGIVIQ